MLQKKIIKAFAISLLFFLFVSCINKRNDNINNVINEWNGKEIIFPDSIKFINYKNEKIECDYKNKYKLLVYVDSMNCTSCALRLDLWDPLYESLESKIKEKLIFIFVLCPKKNRTNDLYLALRSESFKFPVIIDDNDEFNLINSFPQNDLFHTMLLRPDNKVIMIGNPTYNDSMNKLFMKILEKEFAENIGS